MSGGNLKQFFLFFSTSFSVLFLRSSDRIVLFLFFSWLNFCLRRSFNKFSLLMLSLLFFLRFFIVFESFFRVLSFFAFFFASFLCLILPLQGYFGFLLLLLFMLELLVLLQPLLHPRKVSGNLVKSLLFFFNSYIFLCLFLFLYFTQLLLFFFLNSFSRFRFGS